MDITTSTIRALIRFIATCIECGKTVRADQAMCSICANK